MQAEGKELRDRIMEEKAQRKEKAKRLVEHTENAFVWRKTQLALGVMRHVAEEKSHAAKVKHEAEAEARAKNAAAALEVEKALSASLAASNASSIDDKHSEQYASALAKSQVVKELLHVGDIVRVRDLASQMWRKGNVISLDPVVVQPVGWASSFAFDIVDVIPFMPNISLVNGDRVVIAAGHELAPDVREGPLQPSASGIVREVRKSLASGEAAVLVEAEVSGRQWWYRGPSITLEEGVQQTCKLGGCHYAAFALRKTSQAILPASSSMKRRLRAVPAGSKLESCMCDTYCVAVGRCCSDFIEACLLGSEGIKNPITTRTPEPLPAPVPDIVPELVPQFVPGSGMIVRQLI